MRVTHPHFSPNGDRVREKVFLALHADEAVTVDITIRNAANTARKVLHLTLGPGDQTVTWGGRIQRANGSWGRAADGDYTVKLVARDAAGNKTKKLRTVTVDTRPPSFAWTGITPDPWGATGAMTGGGYPDGIRQILDPYVAGDREEAVRQYQRWLPLINYENRQGGILSCKALMREGGIIGCDAGRHPFAAMHPAVRAGLLDAARRLDPMVLRWGR